MPKQQPHFSAYERGYRAGKANTPFQQTGAFRRMPGGCPDVVVNGLYLEGYLRGFAEAQVEAVAAFGPVVTQAIQTATRNQRK